MKAIVAIVLVSLLGFLGCSDSDDGTSSPNYIVQATVSVEDDGSVAFALVLDGDENLIDTLNLTINGDPMNIEYFGDANGESTESDYESPYYTIDLPDLKGGDMVVFEARDQYGEIVYAPEPAVIPMAIELLDPQEGQEFVAGDKIVISWAGGESAEVFSAAYAALDGSAMFKDDLAPEGAGTFIVPAGQTVTGTAIVGVGAITGEITVIDTFDGESISQESFFLVSREMGVLIEVHTSAEASDFTMVPREGSTCGPPNEMTSDKAQISCIGQFAALGIGAIIWENRRQCELKRPNNEPCRKTTNNMEYCMQYGYWNGWATWVTGCVGCIRPYGSRIWGSCWRTDTGNCGGPQPCPH